MAFNKNNDDFSMEIVDNFDFIIEEGSNSSVNLRKVSWNGREPKLDIRKWLYQDGQERRPYIRGVESQVSCPRASNCFSKASTSGVSGLSLGFASQLMISFTTP